ncbi:proline racemase family protein [Bradyrhizobium sp. BR 10289]|nr:proline racemase family protein [Bradyrhizobium sp. BR 10289]
MGSELDDADQIEIPCVVMRGGTSKALFFRSRDLPAPGRDRDNLLKRAMGTPDETQIDGMGGARLNTSKVAIVDPSERPDADVDYTFAQVEIGSDRIGYEGNCGNISSAVGPFAIDEGLVRATEPVTTVRIHNTNTGTILVARVPVAGARARVFGECAIPGVPGTGAEILMDYAGTIGAATGRLLPTGTAIETVHLDDGRVFQTSVCDVANPCVFIEASAFGLRGDESPEQIESDAALIAATEEIRGRVGQALGFWPDWRTGDLPAMPMIVLVGRSADDAPSDMHARLLYLRRCHPTMAGTGAICLAAASRIAGTLVQRVLSERHRGGADVLRIGHPGGTLDVRVVAQDDGRAFQALGFPRTARRLMSGSICIPRTLGS